MPVVTQIQIRRGTASQWTSSNPTLASGEQGFETDTGKMKIGNGATAWNSLAYLGAGTVTSITAGTGLSGGTITTSGTVAIDSTVATLTGAQALTNKDLTGAGNTFPTSLATLTGSQTLTNKTLTTPIISSISNSGTVTLPTGSVTLASLTGTETFTNKTLTDAKVNLAFDAETASYTAVLANNSQVVTMDVGSANTFSIPTNASVAFPIGTQINLSLIHI